MKTTISILATLLAIALTACGSVDVDKMNPSEPTKDDIAAIDNPTKDYCDIYNWYGDGQCDAFCTQPDPDCGATCLAYPSCGPDQVQVDSCDGLSDCESVTMCGATIYCHDDDVSCLTVAVSCGPDATQVDQCDTDDPRCTRLSDGCNADVYCWAEQDQCRAVPVCPDYTTQVDVCDDETECFEVSECGQTILCQQDLAHCEAYPTCPSGYLEVDQCPADASCVDRTMCGYQITCMKDEGVDCLALPVCDEGDTEVTSCPADTSCYQRTLCGQTITCAEQMATCLAIPVCGQDEYQVSNPECAASPDSCRRVSMCGQTIFCKELPDACYDVVGMPPSCPGGTNATNHCTQQALDDGSCFPEFGTGDRCADMIYCQA